MTSRLMDKRFNGYLAIALPHQLDETVTDVVRRYMNSPRPARTAMLESMSSRAASVLSVYGQRMASMSVRQGSTNLLRRGLVAMGMCHAHLTDPRDNIIVLAAVSDAATRLGTSLGQTVDALIEYLPEDSVEFFRGFDRRAPTNKSLEAMMLTAQGEGNSFRYV